ncbi:MAG: hypothetical protein Q9222_000037 [Ikaeria aurantiellina]
MRSKDLPDQVIAEGCDRPDGQNLVIRSRPSRSENESSSPPHDDDDDEDSSGWEDDENCSPEEYDIVRYLKGATEMDKQDLAVMSGWKSSDDRDAEADFMTFLDRQKPKSFKNSWHAADLTPNAERMYEEASDIVKAMEKYNTNQAPFKWCHDLRFRDVHPNTNRRVVPDIEQARAMMMLFFDAAFLHSKHGARFKDSLILNQTERASRGPSKIRSYTSNQYRRKDFWADWDDMKKQKPSVFKALPLSWDIIIRPIIAKLYREGVIGSAHSPRAAGQAIPRTESDGTPDLYFDFRATGNDITIPRQTEKEIPSKEELLHTAQSYAATRPHARFALLRLWSAPHFYPLMLGIDRRPMVSFFDAVGRVWEWKFIPKASNLIPVHF